MDKRVKWDRVWVRGVLMWKCKGEEDSREIGEG